MKISVIVRTCNRPDFLEQSLCSVELQTHTDWEVIVFDDGDSYQNFKIVNEFKSRNPSNLITYYSSGTSYFLFRNSWIIAPRISQGQVMVRLDDDDILDSTALEFISKVFTETPDLDFAYGSSVLFTDGKLTQLIKTNTPLDFPKSRATWEGYEKGHPYNNPWRFKEDVYDEPRHISSIIHASKLNKICVFHPYMMRTKSVLAVLDKLTVTSNFVDDLEFMGSLDNLGLGFNKVDRILAYVRKHNEGQVTEPNKEILGTTLRKDILKVRDKVDELRPSGLDFQSNVVAINVDGNSNDGLTDELQSQFTQINSDITTRLNPESAFDDKFDWRRF